MPLIPSHLRVRIVSAVVLSLAGAPIGSAAMGQTLPPSTVPAKPPRDITQPARPMPGVGNKSAQQLVKVRTVADVDRIAPGQPFLLAFIFDIEQHWHIYWKEPGVSGGPTRIKVKAPEGFVVGRTLFPRPRAFREDAGYTYGYENQTAILVEVTAPMQLHAGQIAFSADVSYMVCKDICLLGRAQPMFTLPTISSPAGSPASTMTDPIVAKFKQRLPKPLDEQDGAAIQFDGSALRITLPAQGQGDAMLFPVEMPGVTYEDAVVEVKDNVARLRVPVEINPQNAQGKTMMVAGMIALGDDDDDPCYEFEIPAGDSAQDLSRLVDPAP